MKTRHILLSTITAGLILTACGGGGGSSSDTTKDSQKITSKSKGIGYFIDSPIVGARYSSGTQENFTKIGGSFKYDDENIKFYVGDILIGSINKIPNDKIVMLQDVLGIDRSDLTNEKLIKAATLIQSLDTNQNTRAIELKKDLTRSIKNPKSLDEINIDDILAKNNMPKKSRADVIAHLKKTLDGINDTSLPNLEKISPYNGQQHVGLNEFIEIKFSKLLRYDTFLNKVFIKDSKGNDVKFNTYLNENIMILKPHALQKDMKYRVSIDGVKDYDSNTPKKITFEFTTTNDKDAKVDASSGASPLLENGGYIDNESDSHNEKTKINLSTTKKSEISWDKATVTDAIGKIEDRVDYAVVKRFGMTEFGVDLQTPERVVNLNGKNNFLVATSRYHNALNVINYNEGSYNYNKFAAFKVNYATGVGGLLSSGSSGGSTSENTDAPSGDTVNPPAPQPVDTVSGASSRSLHTRAYSRALEGDESCKAINKHNPKSLWEHNLIDAKITNDGKSVYALILPKFDVESFNSQSTFGLFKASVGYCGVNPYNAATTKRLDSRGVKSMKLSDDDQFLAVYGKSNDKNVLRIYNANLSKVISAAEFDDLSGYDFAFNNNAIVGITPENLLDKAKIIKFNAKDLSSKIEKILPFSPEIILGTYDKAVAISKKKGLIASFDSNLNMLKEIKVNFAITKATISPNGNYLALGNKENITTFQLSDSKISEISNYKINGLRAISFVNDSLLAYTPTKSANSVITLKIGENKDASAHEEVEEKMLNLGEFQALNITSQTTLYGKANIVTNFKDKVLTYTHNSTDDKGYNLFGISSGKFNFTVGTKSTVSKFYGNGSDVIGLKMIDANAFVVVSANENNPSFSNLYVQKLLDDGSIQEGFTPLVNNNHIGNSGTPKSVTIAKNSNTVFVTKKALVENYYLVDVYTLSNGKYTLIKKDIPLEHLETTTNSVAPNDSGTDFYSFGNGKVYQNSSNKSVHVKNANGIFYENDLVFVSTSDGKLYTFDKNLEAKKAYNFAFGVVKNIESNGNTIVVFTDSGVYTLNLQNGTLKADKKQNIQNLVSGYVNGNKAFAISNSAYDINAPRSSNIYYLNF